MRTGTRALYSGLTFTLIRAVPVASVILPTYDATYHFLSGYLAGLEKSQPSSSAATPEF